VLKLALTCQGLLLIW